MHEPEKEKMTDVGGLKKRDETMNQMKMMEGGKMKMGIMTSYWMVDHNSYILIDAVDNS